MIRFIRIYKAENGIWRIDIERDGVVRWSSLRTRDEGEAKWMAQRYCESLAAPGPQEGRDVDN